MDFALPGSIVCISRHQEVLVLMNGGLTFCLRLPEISPADLRPDHNGSQSSNPSQSSDVNLILLPQVRPDIFNSIERQLHIRPDYASVSLGPTICIQLPSTITSLHRSNFGAAFLRLDLDSADGPEYASARLIINLPTARVVIEYNPEIGNDLVEWFEARATITCAERLWNELAMFGCIKLTSLLATLPYRDCPIVDISVPTRCHQLPHVLVQNNPSILDIQFQLLNRTNYNHICFILNARGVASLTDLLRELNTL